MLQSCICLSVVCNICIVAKWCILVQKLLLTAIYEKSTGTKMNDLDGMSTNCNLRYYAYFAERNFAENVTTTARVSRTKQ